MRLGSLFPALAFLLASSAAADTFRVILPRTAAPPVSFGAADMVRALVQAGHALARGRAAATISVTTSGPGGAEAFTIERRGATVQVAGGDTVGAMYGLLEVGEQVAEGGGKGLLAAIRPTIRRPFLTLRADSPTLWLTSSGALPPVLADAAFWRRYLAGLARSRFNLLHLHGFVDPATGQPHSLLERLMPAAGVPDPEPRRAVKALAALAILCKERGIRLAITDDAAGEAPAAAASARRLLAAVPGLWGLGARASGPGAAALFAAMTRVAASRAFLAGPDSAAPSPTAQLPGRAFAVLPVNAGSFALPYPVLESRDAVPPAVATTGPSDGTTPAAEADLPRADPRLLSAGRPPGARLLWEVPAGRIAPALPWYDPAFIRRIVRAAAAVTVSSVGAQGVLIEPPASLFSAHIPHAASLDAAWWWHPAWGRLAYEPAEPDARLDGWFQRRYGEEPGWRIARSLARVSAVVPLIAAAHTAHAAGEVPRIPEIDPGTLEEWTASPALDPRAQADISAWAVSRLDGEADGRLDPVQLSFTLAEAAMRTRNEVDTIEILHPGQPNEWHALRRRIEALCHLADFGARRLSAAAHLELHRRTGDEMELELASGHASLAGVAWAAMERMLAPGGEREVGHMSLPDSPPPAEGPFAADAAAIARLQSDLAQELAMPRAAPRIAHVPSQHATPTRAHRITATVMSGENPATVTLVYRLVDRAGASSPEKERPMTRLFDTRAFYQAEIQGPELTEGFLEYQIRAAGGFGADSTWPGEGSWRRIPVTRDESGPTIRPLQPRPSGRTARLSCEAVDPSGVSRVRAYVRPLAGSGPWRAVAMSPVRDHYQVEVPLGIEGLQYAFEATDTWGNGTTAPDVRSATPYLLLSPLPAPMNAPARSIRVRPGH